MVRTGLFEAANVMLTRAVRFSTLKAWGAAGRQPARHEEGQGGAGPQTDGGAPHVGRWHDFRSGKAGVIVAA
jgi:hypothetical protein